MVVQELEDAVELCNRVHDYSGNKSLVRCITTTGSDSLNAMRGVASNSRELTQLPDEAR